MPPDVVNTYKGSSDRQRGVVLLRRVLEAARSESGKHPWQMLSAEDDGTTDNFWVVDERGSCGRQVRYRSAADLT